MRPWPACTWISASSPFTPSSLPNMVAWYAADSTIYSDAGTTPVTNTGSVQQWNDKSGNGYNVSQATLAKRPTYSTGAINGNPEVVFDGVDDFIAFTTGFTAVGARTIYLVVKHRSTASTNYVFDGWTGTPHRSSVGILSPNWHMYAGNNCPAGTADTNYNIHAAVFNATSSFRYVNNIVQAAAGSVGTDTLIDLVIGSGRQGTGFFSACNIAEVIVYSGVHSSTDVASVSTYLNSKYAVY